MSQRCALPVFILLKGQGHIALIAETPVGTPGV